MCGIVGYVGNRQAADIVFEGLKKLEYRGYDSAGIAVVGDSGLDVRRSAGKLTNLRAALSTNKLNGRLGIGHTRWATHGRPSQENAHPHMDESNSIVVVHNGIIENYVELKNDLIKEGVTFRSETDTEVIAHLVKKYFKGDLFAALKQTLKDLRGSYAVGVICKDNPDLLVCARHDAPLIIGVGEGENFIASDIPALLGHTKKVIFLENNDIAEITPNEIKIENAGKSVTRAVQTILWDAVAAEKSGYRHFMLKEIFEQPRSIEETLRGRVNQEDGKVYIDDINLDPEFINKLTNIYIVACGTAYYAGLVAKFIFENFCRIAVDVDVASEFRYRDPVLNSGSLAIFISQSGETADTLAALELAKQKGATTIAICNVVGSSISRKAHHTFYTHCGPEIGVASTKAFTAQLAALYILALDWADKRKTLDGHTLKNYIKQLLSIPLKVSEFLNNCSGIEQIAKKFANKRDFLYLARHVNYPIALEGALKLKEISYIHAEGYPAGEMKHGPIALIDERMPIVAIMPRDSVYEKILSNIQEARARGAVIIAITNESKNKAEFEADYKIIVPKVEEFFSPIINVLPLQLLAYYISVALGCDVDQPRNLAKSVTVE